MARVYDIYNAINSFAPFKLQENWDNAGLIVGDMQSEVKTAVLALDITNPVIQEAAKFNAQLIISHHPVIFNAIKRVPSNSPVYNLAKNNMSAICAHTNLDIAKGGVNTVLADILGIKDTVPLSIASCESYKQIRVYVPISHTEKVYEAMVNAGAGELDGYSGCAYISDGQGRFIPGDNTNPYVGGHGQLERTHEQLISIICPPDKLKNVIEDMIKVHPYEVPAYEITDNRAVIQNEALGLIGKLDNEYTPEQLAIHVKNSLQCGGVRLYASDKPITKVAICSGSGGSLLDDVIKTQCDAFITADVRHDVALSAIEAGITLIDAGHFETENIVIKPLADKLSNMIKDVNFIIAENGKAIVKYI